MLGNRGLATAGVAALAASTAFPVVAALTPAERFSTWLGAVDVGLAFIVVAFAAWIEARSHGRVGAAAALAAVRVCRGFAAVPLALLAVFLVAGGAVRWEVLLPGLAWRGGVLLYAAAGTCALLSGGAPDAEPDGVLSSGHFDPM